MWPANWVELIWQSWEEKTCFSLHLCRSGKSSWQGLSIFQCFFRFIEQVLATDFDDSRAHFDAFSGFSTVLLCSGFSTLQIRENANRSEGKKTGSMKRVCDIFSVPNMKGKGRDALKHDFFAFAAIHSPHHTSIMIVIVIITTVKIIIRSSSSSSPLPTSTY